MKKCCTKNQLLATCVILASCLAIYVAYNTQCDDYHDAVHPYSETETDKKVFTKMYKKKFWSKWSDSNLSKDEQGHHPFVDYLQDFITQHNVSTIIDMGCGYGELLKDLHLPENTKYTGLDIVNSVIAYNKLHYERQNVSYGTVDDIKDLSKFKGDLLILKDVIQYWSINKIMYAKNHILPNFKYAIIVNDIYFPNLGPVNSEIITGNSRPLNLEISPFYIKFKTIKDYKGKIPSIKRIYLYENEKYQTKIEDSH